MLNKDFYTLHATVVAVNSLTTEISFNPAHAIFGGHFPEQPVVPGVCMIQIVKEVLQQHVPSAGMLKTAAQVKFLQLITPEIHPALQLSWSFTDTGILVQASFRKEKDLFKFSGNFQLLQAEQNDAA